MEKLNIAIADDNERMVNLLGTLIRDDSELELVGQADNGKDIYDIIKEKEPDVVLLDIIMPKVDGFAVLQFMKDAGIFARVPVIVISADSDAKTERECLKLGASDFIRKPFDNMTVKPFSKDEYNSKTNITLEDIVDFHFRFERIHPFGDGNGRVGRIIMFKECLKNNITPFIIDDEYKLFYYRGLREYNNIKGISSLLSS